MANMTKVQLTGLKAAPYYGCLLVRTPGIEYFEDRENPTSMDELLEAVGAKVADWGAKTECCGASMAATEEGITNGRLKLILDEAEESGANCIVTACPLCQTNLDMYQYRQAKETGVQPDMPVFFLSELIAMALGANVGRREWRKHFVDPGTLLNSLSIHTA